MRYNGGKHSCAKEIADIINKIAVPGQDYIEPFVGAASVIQHVRNYCHLVGFDLDASIISLLCAVRDRWIPPDTITLEQYRAAKDLADDNPLKAFCKFGCSFGGKPWGGYARSGDRNYALNAKKSLMKQAPFLKYCKFFVGDYKDCLNELDETEKVIYCDPPYKNTTTVRCGGKFDTEAFWEWVRTVARKHIVLVSELAAPDDFVCIWQKSLKDGLGAKKLTEKLFIHNSQESVLRKDFS